MKIPEIDTILQEARVPENYSVDYLKTPDLETLVAKLKEWFPAIVTGSESCFLDPKFYYDQVHLENDSQDKKIFGLVTRHHAEIVAFSAAEINFQSRWVSGRLTVISPLHRNKDLGDLCVRHIENMGKAFGAGMAWTTVTLEHIFGQRLMEKCGYKLCGFIPAWDRDFIDGKSVYVSEALYVKIFARPEELRPINPQNLSDQVKSLWNFLNRPL